MSLPALSANDKPNLGLARSALLMRALGAKATAVWSQLSPQEAEQLSEAMQSLPEDDAGEQRALQSYVQSMRVPATLTTSSTGSVWARLSQKDGALIASFIQNESPQVIALTLSRLSPEAAADTVRALPRSLATDALKRLLNLGDVHPAALKALAMSLEQRLELSQTADLNGGHEHVARIFDQLDGGSESKLLSSLDSAEPGAGEKIRALMFTFDDLAKLDPGSLQTILGNVDRAVLTIALKGAATSITDAFFKNVTQRAGALLREEIASTGPVRRSEIDAARAEVLMVARSLVKRGDLLPQSSDDELIE
ncbi:MAG: FliG C-terminal domain-containing protein [Henriciella sp.]